jgi:hypothetical protein
VTNEAEEKCNKISQKWENHGGRGADGSYRTSFRGSDVVIKDIVASVNSEGFASVDVWTGNSKKPAFRIVNPPMYVKDPYGHEEATEMGPDQKERKVRVKEDPIQAIVEAISEVRKR